MLRSSVIDCIGETPLVRLRNLYAEIGVEVFAKLEMLNPGGSIKDRSAKGMIEQALFDGTATSDSHLLESSSGNFAIAMAMVAKHYHLPFTCVVDPRICESNLRILRRFDAEVSMVTTTDSANSFLEARLVRLQELLEELDGGVWLNQYTNDANWQTYYNGIAEEIIRDMPGPVDAILIAVSTCGTIMGISRRLREENPDLRVIAVDVIGSAIFGAQEQERSLPGIGSSTTPPILDSAIIDEVLYVSEDEAIAGAQGLLAAEGILAGASSGAVVAAIAQLVPRLPEGHRLLTVFPDRGERYLDTVYGEMAGRGCGDLYPMGTEDEVASRASWQMSLL